MTTPVDASLRQLAHDCEAMHLQWALIGGLAVSARTEPRFTRDVDVCVLVADDTGAEAAVRHFGGLGYAVDSVVEHEYVDRLSTVRLRPPLPGGVLIDLLFASSGIEPEIVQEADRIELLPGLVVPIARVEHLITLKLLARDDETRPQDAADLVALRQVLTEADERGVRRLVRLVVARGYHRERNLVTLAETFIASDRLS